MTSANNPQHIAIILDGNNRWGSNKIGSKFGIGHEAGADTVQTVIDSALENKIPYITLFAFSTENFNRSAKEVDYLLSLFYRISTSKKSLKSMQTKGVRFKTIGNIDAFADRKPKLPSALRQLEENTKNNNQLVLTIALNYGGRWDITNAAQKLALEVQNNKILPQDINENMFSDYLSTAGTPDPDLLIRTSNELRLSNFLLWQCSYAEFYFTSTLWPDFKQQDFMDALNSYKERNRRFGKRIC